MRYRDGPGWHFDSPVAVVGSGPSGSLKLESLAGSWPPCRGEELVPWPPGVLENSCRLRGFPGGVCRGFLGCEEAETSL